MPVILDKQLVAFVCLGDAQANRFSERDSRRVDNLIQQAWSAHQRLYIKSQSAAVQEERGRIGHELHDSVVQVFYSISLGGNTARAMLKHGAGQVDEQLKAILELSEAGMTELRAIMFDLRPEALREEGLVTALTKLAQLLRIRHKLEVIEKLGVEPAIELNIKEVLYRVSQEAIHNIVKHAHAQKVSLVLDYQFNTVRLEIKDDGRGFNPKFDYLGHHGLRSMRERVMQVGGNLTIESVPNKGTTLRAVIMLQ